MLSTDAHDFALDNDGDIELDQRQGFRLVSGSEGLAQAIKISILRLRGEWFLNLDDGMPWFDMLGAKFASSGIQQEVAKRIEIVPGAGNIRSISSALDSDRRASVDFDVASKWGDTVTGTIQEPSL